MASSATLQQHPALTQLSIQDIDDSTSAASFSMAYIGCSSRMAVPKVCAGASACSDMLVEQYVRCTERPRVHDCASAWRRVDRWQVFGCNSEGSRMLAASAHPK